MTSRLDGGISLGSVMLTNNSSHRSYVTRHKEKYYNYHKEKHHGVVFNSIMMFFKSLYARTTRKKPLSTEWVVPYNPAPSFPEFGLTWIGHSTFLIHCDDITLITDPIFGNASFLFQRIFPPGIGLQQLPSIDYVLLSHNHRDHMDAQSLLALRHHNSSILVPQGNKSWFIRRGFRVVTEYDWWQSTTIVHKDQPITFTFLPAQHWSQRTLFDRNRSLWGSWMIQYKNHTIYFAGDTAYASHFSEIKKAFPTIDVALLPIGPCEPHHWMKMAHVNAQQAGQAFLDLEAQHFIPMHWATFYFGTDSFEKPVEQLRGWWHKHKLDHSKLHILKIGQQWHVQ